MPEEVREWRRKTVLLGISIPIVVAAIVFLFQSERLLWPFFDQSKLVTTSGKIVSSEFEHQGGRRSAGWYFMIRYQYQVNGKTYLSNRVHYSYTGSKDKSYAEGYVAKYPVGSVVLVYYDPEYPERSVLEPTIKDYSLWHAIMSWAILGIFFISLNFWIR